MWRTLRKMIENKQPVFLILGLCCFISVIYILSLHNAVRKSVAANKLNRIKNVSFKSPNFVFILTDDQDTMLGSMQAMKMVQKYIINKGINFKNSFVASPLCCPSRSSILSGQYVHNHKAFNNSYNGGCSNKIWQRGPEKKSFVTYLQQANYETFFAGKYLNQYGREEAGGLSHIPPGWNWWVGLEGNSKYYNYSLSVNGTKVDHGSDPSTDYFTNVIRRQALDFLHYRSTETSPFFMMLSTPSCHAPFTPEPKYDHSFDGVKAPRTPNFNVVNDHTKHWLLRLGEQPLRPQIVNALDEIQRNRLRTLLTVDDMVKDVIDTLELKGLLSSTYIIFTSDNGFHLGQFSLPYDKREPYEFDIRVPLAIRGPGIPPERELTFPVINIDIAPTILDLANIPIPKHFDGESLKTIIQSDASSTVFGRSERRESSTPKKTWYEVSEKGYRKTVLVEHSGEGKEINKGCEYLGENLSGCNPEFSCKCSDAKNNTYSCLRHVSQEEDFLFCSWSQENDFEEMYDLLKDSSQLSNIASSLSPERHKKLLFTLNNLKKCRGKRCNKLSRFVF